MPKAASGTRRIARLVRSTDFERVLKTRQRAATAHFAMHHLFAVASSPPVRVEGTHVDGLSTTSGTTGGAPVDDSAETALPPGSQWLGAVVPKRHARRAVTRSLLKRQIYAAGERHRGRIGSGLWVVRQRAPFDRVQFPSAASDALKQIARAELDSLFEAASR